MNDSEAIRPTQIIPPPRFAIRVYDRDSLALAHEENCDAVLASSACRRAEAASRDEWGRNYVLVMVDREANSTTAFRGGMQLNAKQLTEFTERMGAHKAEIKRQLRAK